MSTKPLRWRLVPHRLVTRRCRRGRCTQGGGFHTHHLTRIGEWVYRA